MAENLLGHGFEDLLEDLHNLALLRSSTINIVFSVTNSICLAQC